MATEPKQKYRKQIENLRNKLDRQLQAAEQTRDLIAALEQLSIKL